MATTMKSIAKQTLIADAASVTFSSIPSSGYTDLRLLLSARTNRAAVGDSMYINFNGDTTSANYNNILLYGTGTSMASITTNRGICLTQGSCGDSNTASTFGNSEVYIPNYTGSTTKSVLHYGSGETNASTSYMSIDVGRWSGTAAITSIVITPGNGTNFKSGSTFYLYGITKA